jgi:hypothetical protein
MAARPDVDVNEMPQDPRPDQPRDDEARPAVPAAAADGVGPHAGSGDVRRDAAGLGASDLEDLLDGDEDPRVAALLGAVTTRLTAPPDELTRRRHLAAMRRASGPPLLLRAAQRTGVAAAAALVVGGLLAGGGWLPDPIQREVADAAAQVGLELPRPEPREQVGHETDAPDARPTADEADADADAGPGREPGDDAAERRSTDDDRDVPERSDDPAGDGPETPREELPRSPLPEDGSPGSPDLLDPRDVEPDERRHVVPIEPPIRPRDEGDGDDDLRGTDERREREGWLTEDDEDDHGDPRPDGGFPRGDD